MTTYSKEQIAQALMQNYQSEVVSNVDRDRQPGHSLMLQLFNISGYTRFSRLNMVYLPKEGELTVYSVFPMRVHNPVSNHAAYRNRVQYVQVSMNDKRAINDDGRYVVKNTNPEIVNMFLASELKGPSGQTYYNPYNCLDVVGYLRLAPVPSVFGNAAYVEAYNKCSEEIIRYHERMKDYCKENGTDLASNGAYRKKIEELYTIYQQSMEILIQRGIVSLSQVITAQDNELVPAFKLDSSDTKEDNPFLDSGSLLKRISYMPTLNMFYGSAEIKSSAKNDDINPSLTTGIRSLSNDTAGGGTEGATSKGRQEATRLASISDTFGNTSTILLRRQDMNAISARNPNQQGLAAVFDKATSGNEMMFVQGKYQPIVATVDQGGSTNGLLRATVVVGEYTKIQTNGLSRSTEGGSNALTSAMAEVNSLLTQGIDFAAQPNQGEQSAMAVNTGEQSAMGQGGEQSAMAGGAALPISAPVPQEQDTDEGEDQPAII